MIHRTPFLLPWLYPSLHWRIPTDRPELFLTFDDGPVPGPTEFVLDALRAFSVEATFFCIGDNVRKHPEVFGRLLTEGHAVGNHTFHHVNGWRTTAPVYLEEVERCHRELRTHGASTRLFRPPYGRITRRQINHLRDHQIVMWDVLSRDYDRTLSPERCLRETQRALRPGSIVVFHDSLKAARNMEFALPRLLAFARDAGYTCKSLVL